MAAPLESGTRVFHESWYRVADQRIALRASVRIHRQLYRCETWYVLHDPFTNQYWRIRPAAYAFIARLSPRRTIEEIWYELLKTDPEGAPGQGEIIELLGQLYQSNMLHYGQAEDGERLFERHRKRTRQQVRSNLLNILYLRIPLWDPDGLLKRLLPLARLLFSRLGGLVWLAMFGYAAKIAVENWEALADQAQGVLAPSNLVYLYLCSFAIKIVHEFGHAMAVRRQGGEVHAMGVTLMLLAPLPYMDATASWSFRERWRRILVASSGMLFEFFVAGLALIVWQQSGGGAIKALAYNVLFVASVTTLLFNLNPLMRFDGYYILADALDMPNLGQHANQHVQYLFERYVFGVRAARTPATSRGESWTFALYGISSLAYRILIFGGILFAISQHYLILAVVMGALIALSWALIPLGRFVGYLAASPRLRGVRPRAVGVCVATLAAVGWVGAAVPVPDTFKAPGIVEARAREVVVNATAGRVARMLVASGRPLAPGDTIAVLENPELLEQIDQSEAQIAETDARFQLALTESPEDIEAFFRRMQVLEQQHAKLLVDRDNLVVRARIAGMWCALAPADLAGRWLPRGDSLGEIIDSSSYRFVAAVPQDAVERLFARKAPGATVRLRGEAAVDLRIDSLRAIPMERTRLPSAALGWYGGGDIEVDQTQGDPNRSAEPFYLVEAALPHRPDGAVLLHGRSGRIRFLSGYTPLLPQAWRRLRQLTQKYYRL